MSNTYNVYLGVYAGAPRDHHAIWVDTGSTHTKRNGTTVPAGQTIQVTGNIQQGMSFEVKAGTAPQHSDSGIKQIFIGVIKVTDLDKLKTICRSIPPPQKQFNGPKKLDPRAPLYRCQDWTADAINALKSAGVLIP